MSKMFYYLIKCIFCFIESNFSIIYFSLSKWACRSIALPMNYCTVQYSARGVYSTYPSWPLNTISDRLSVLPIGQSSNSLFNRLGIGRLRHQQQWLHTWSGQVSVHKWCRSGRSPWSQGCQQHKKCHQIRTKDTAWLLCAERNIIWGIRTINKRGNVWNTESLLCSYDGRHNAVELEIVLFITFVFVMILCSILTIKCKR